jgi:diguanylate cyclase (GGDEF)-like protein/PAS domain S-box-containing protein
MNTSEIVGEITGGRSLEETLEAEGEFRLLFESNPIPMWVFHRYNLHFLAVNRAAVLQYGYLESEFLSMSIRDIRPESDIPDLLTYMNKPNIGLQKPGVWTHRRKNGDIIEVEIVCHSLTFRGKSAMLVAAHDVTETRRAKEILQDSEAKYRALFEGSTEAHLLLNRNGFVDCNLAALEMFGLSTKSELVHPSELSPPCQPDGSPSRAAADEKIAVAFDQGKAAFEWLHLRKNGEVFPAEVTLTALTLAGQPVLMSTVRDITERKRSEEALLFKTALLEAQSETSIDGILLVDDEGHVVTSNQQFARHFQIPEEIMGSREDRALLDFATGQVEDSESFLKKVQYLYAHKEEKSRDEFRLKSGRTFDRYSSPLIDSRGQHRGRIWYFRDITEQKEAEAAAWRAEEKYRAIFENSVVGIFQVSPEGRPININPALAHLYGYDSAEQLMAEVQNMAEQLFVDSGKMIELARLAEKSGAANGVEVEIFQKNRTKKCARMNMRAVHDTLGAVVFYEGTVEDITDRRAAEKRVQFLAYYDSLTGLPNRTLFSDRLGDAITRARKERQQIALLHFDLDRFKNINDSLGHTVGDHLIKDVAARLQECTQKQDFIARVGGDGFLILLSQFKDMKDVEAAAERIVESMTRDFTIQGLSLSMTCSMGISIFPEHGDDGEGLLKSADTAMYCAKEGGGNCFRFFFEDLSIRVTNRLRLENDLRLALERHEFFLVYQPQMNIISGEISGVEALIRWQHPELGIVPPDKFIGVAEKCGLIASIGEWVLRTACAQARKWLDDGLKLFPIAVNVSALQFRQKGFCQLVAQVLTETGLSPHFLELELTESLLASDADMMTIVLQELKGLGVNLAIDDFGTGFSSFAYLKKFLPDKLKIDRSFVQNLVTDSKDAAIITAIISMAKSLQMKVIAEGVENEGQLSFLRESQCDEIQGYFLSKPIVADELANRFRCMRNQSSSCAATQILVSTPSCE